MPLTLILSVGLDQMLLDTRALVLQSAGYIVVTAFSIKEAAVRFQDGDFDLVLLCRSIPAEERESLTIWIRASGSRIPVVSVSGNPGEQDARSSATIDSDPKALLTGIEEMLHPAANSTDHLADHNRREVIAVRGKKPPISNTGLEPESNCNKEHSVPFAHAG